MSFVRITTPDDIISAQRHLATDAAGVNISVQACTSLDAPTRDAWNVWYASVQALVAQKPVWFFPTGPNEVLMSTNMLENVEAYRSELYARQQALSAKCNIVVPAVDPDKPLPEASLVTALKWGAFIAGAVGVAYVTSEVASTVRLFKAATPSKG
jgi:hypothetical protein